MEELTSLIVRVRKGERECYGQLVRQFQDMALGYAYSLLGDFHLAEDAAQESFMFAYLEMAQLKEPEAFPGWFRRIIHTQCGRLRRRQRGQTVELDRGTEAIAEGMNPVQALEASESQDRLLRAMNALPELDRSIVALFYISRLNHKDIAAFLDMPVGKINNRLYSARKRLREELTLMTTDNLQSSRPSMDDEFVTRIEARIQAIERVHTGLSKGLTEVFTQTLEEQTEVEIRQVVRTTFAEYLNKLTSPSLTLHFLVEPTGGRIIFDLTPDLATAVAEKVLSAGKSSWVEIERGMDPQDWKKLGPFGHSVRQLLEEVWKPAIPLKLADAVWESNIVGLLAHPDFGSFPLDEKLAELHDAPAAPAVRLDLGVTGDNFTCQMSLCYPSAALEGVLPHLSM